jgi:chromatin segregation and condensation protein Rec8/ScpA/Scc1 (kleisin family)
MSSKSKIKVNIKKIDAIIVVILMIIAGLVLIKAGYIYPFQEDIFEPEQDEEEIKPAPPPPPYLQSQ